MFILIAFGFIEFEFYAILLIVYRIIEHSFVAVKPYVYLNILIVVFLVTVIIKFYNDLFVLSELYLKVVYTVFTF